MSSSNMFAHWVHGTLSESVESPTPLYDQPVPLPSDQPVPHPSDQPVPLPSSQPMSPSIAQAQREIYPHNTEIFSKISELLENRRDFNVLYDSNSKIHEIMKTHKVFTRKPFKPITSTLYPHHTAEFTLITPNVLECTLHSSGSKIWGGQFILNATETPKITSITMRCGDIIFDVITDADLRAWNYTSERSATGAYILHNPFWFKHIYSPIYCMNEKVTLSIETASPIEGATFVYQTVFKNQHMEAIPDQDEFSIIRAHINETTCVQHNVPYMLPALKDYPKDSLKDYPKDSPIYIEDVAFLMSIDDLANIKSFSIISDMGYPIFDDIPIDGFISLDGVHVSFRVPVESGEDANQPTGYISSANTRFQFRLINQEQPINMIVVCKYINFVIYMNGAMILRYAR